MSSRPDLYFIALIPPEPWKEAVTELKKEFSTYKSFHALKSPPHVTLIPPFRMGADSEPKLKRELNEFAASRHQFSLRVVGFGAFKPRVIFLEIELSDDLTALYDGITRDFGYLIEDSFRSNKRFHPHMTLAFRDLTKSMFHKAWDHYRDKEFSFEFQVESVYLLKHNGKFWDVMLEAGFEGFTSP